MTQNYYVGKLYIKDCSLPVEETNIAGVLQRTYTAVKNSPFNVQLGLDTSNIYDSTNPNEAINFPVTPLTLSHVKIDGILLFNHAEEKKVDFVKKKPMDFKVTTLENGMEANCEIKLKVLSSQLEDMLFRIRFRTLDVIRGQEICSHMITTSDPIKIISKPERTNKRQKNKGKKPTNNDIILSSLENIYQKQQEQFNHLQQLLSNVTGGKPPGTPINSSGGGIGVGVGGAVKRMRSELPNSSHSFDSSLFSLPPSQNESVTKSLSLSTQMGEQSSPFFTSLFDQPPTKKQKIDDDRPLDFETSFHDMMRAFENLSSERRSEQMEDFVRSHRISSNQLTELHDMLSSGGLARPIGQTISQSNTNLMDMDGQQDCLCENCPFRKEVESRENFFQDVMSWFK